MQVERRNDEAQYTLTVGGLSGGGAAGPGMPADPLQVVEFRATEAISELFCIELDLVSPDPELDLKAIVGQDALLSMYHLEGEQYLHGIVSFIEQGQEGRHTTRYRAEIVPRVWLLSLRKDNRIFQDKSVPDILKEVFTTAGVVGNRLELRLSANYSPRNYVVQYGETDLQFAMRLMEEEGIFFFFDHSKDDHVLVLGDERSAYQPIDDAQVLYQPVPTGVSAEQHVWEFRFAERVRPGKVSLTDYTFKQPTLSLQSSANGATDEGLESYEYPGEYVAPGIGQKLVEVRMQELQVARRMGHGRSNIRRFSPGKTFKLGNHPTNERNRSYLITRVRSMGGQPEPGETENVGSNEEARGREWQYRNEFEVIPDAVLFRPNRLTRRPTISGVQTAIVTGPAGEEIYVDEFGRVKVQFHWDRQGTLDENSSCWVRVSQAWAGTGFGHVFLPRIGQEVIVQFIEGDPDRPLITGRVYNGDNALPYPLPAEKTKSTIKSNSTKGGGGFNEFRFEDLKGQEEIFLHGQKDWNTVVLNDVTASIGHNESDTVGNDRSRSVGNNETINIGNDQSITVGNDQSTSVGNDQTLSVGNDRSATVGNDETISIGNDQSLTVGNNRTHTVGVNETISVGTDQSIEVGSNQSTTVGTNQSIDVGADQTTSVGANQSTQVACDQSTEVGASQSLSVGADQGTSVKGSRSLSVTGNDGTLVDGNQSIEVGQSQTVKVGASQSIDVTDNITITCGATTVTVDSSGNVCIDGKDIVVNASNNATVNAGSNVFVKAGGNVDMSGALIKLNVPGGGGAGGSGGSGGGGGGGGGGGW